MKTSLTWTKGIFSSIYHLFSNGNLIGSLEESFTKSAKGSFNGKNYIFRTQGFLKHNTMIIDCSDNKIIGQIDFSNWMTKAVITINGKKINWKYDNSWSTRWSLFDADGIIATFSGSTTKGFIDTNIDDGLLILSGLFVTNFYWQMSFFIILIIVFIPIMF
jgi:hypothetical protein